VIVLAELISTFATSFIRIESSASCISVSVQGLYFLILSY